MMATKFRVTAILCHRSVHSFLIHAQTRAISRMCDEICCSPLCSPIPLFLFHSSFDGWEAGRCERTSLTKIRKNLFSTDERNTNFSSLNSTEDFNGLLSIFNIQYYVQRTHNQSINSLHATSFTSFMWPYEDPIGSIVLLWLPSPSSSSVERRLRRHSCYFLSFSTCFGVENFTFLFSAPNNEMEKWRTNKQAINIEIDACDLWYVYTVTHGWIVVIWLGMSYAVCAYCVPNTHNNYIEIERDPAFFRYTFVHFYDFIHESFVWNVRKAHDKQQSSITLFTERIHSACRKRRKGTSHDAYINKRNGLPATSAENKIRNEKLRWLNGTNQL